MRRTVIILCLLIVTLIVVGSVGFIKAGEPSTQINTTVKIDKVQVIEELPVVGSYERLKELLGKMEGDYNLMYGGMRMRAGMDANPASMDEAGNSAMKVEERKEEKSKASKDYSTTNVQVDGVDEADIIKTDGQYIYQVNKGRIIIAKIYPSEEMKVTGSIGFSDGGFNPQELYLHNQYMIVIGSASKTYSVEQPEYNKSTVKKSKSRIMPEYYGGTVKVMIYDCSDKANLRKVREVELDGNYFSSRKVGASLYFAANRYINRYYMQGDENEQTYIPTYRDTAIKDENIGIGYGKIRYFPDCYSPNYLITAGLDLDRINEGVQVSTYLGAGQNIYSSADNMYVAVTGYKNVNKSTDTNPIKKSGVVFKDEVNPVINERNTTVYKFELSKGKMTYTSKGEVPGDILNQFSMDEDGKYFRIATTRGDMWRNDENTSRNNLYILDENLKVTGKIEDIAPGEKIYSVRFMGQKAYMVTFKNVDPLFVIDLKDPTNPKILGALKIPGYSDYIHPYDENHIIGFGKDAIEKDGMAYYQGMKIAMSDVSDVSNPKEMFVEKIGDRGTDSEILHNHKALLFSKEKNLLAFPVTLMEVQGGNKEQNGKTGLEYGQFTFQGAYVYNVDLEKGFSLRGRITHISQQEYLKAGGGWYGSDKNVERILYIGDTLYTLSKGMIKANTIDTLDEKASLNIP